MNRTQLVVSLRSRGLISIQRDVLFDLRYHVANIFTEALDLFLCAIYTFAFMSWSAWISLGITLIVAGQATTLDEYELPNEAVFWPFYSYVILPLLMLLAWVVWRRERANSAMAHAKALLVSLLLHASSLVPPAAVLRRQAEAGATESDVPGASAPAPVPASQPVQLTPIAAAALDLRVSLLSLLDDLRAYLAHNRPYARHFFAPYLSNENPRGTLYTVSRQMGALLRKVHLSVRHVHISAGCLREALACGHDTSFHSPPGMRKDVAGAVALKQVPLPAADSVRLNASGVEPVGGSAGDTAAQGGADGAGAGAVAESANNPTSATAGGAVGVPTQAATPAAATVKGQGSTQPMASAVDKRVGSGTAGNLGPGRWVGPGSRAFPVQGVLLEEQVLDLHKAVEQLSAIKEMRTPVMLRAMVRWFTVVIIPVFMGFYWIGAAVRDNDAMGVFMAALTQVALMVVCDVVVALEDPFNDAAPDTLSLLEVMDHVAAMAGEEEVRLMAEAPGPGSGTTPANGAAGTAGTATGGASYSPNPLTSAEAYALASAATPWGASLGQEEEEGGARRDVKRSRGPSLAAPPMPPLPMPLDVQSIL